VNELSMSVPVWGWLALTGVIAAMLAVDLFVHRDHHVIGFREAAVSSARWRSWLSRASSRRCVVSAARHIESRRHAQRSLADAGISMMSMSSAWWRSARRPRSLTRSSSRRSRRAPSTCRVFQRGRGGHRYARIEQLRYSQPLVDHYPMVCRDRFEHPVACWPDDARVTNDRGPDRLLRRSSPLPAHSWWAILGLNQ
jgi:hypothetical protein